MPLQAGTRIGGYEIVALLGAGGMGEVYRARDLRLGRDVAIKVLSPQIAADADALQRFEREARALASLNHPNIGAIYGVDGNAAQPALVLELVDGETLADRIARGAVPAGEAIEYARQIADALDVAHEAGIVHRDLKPGNIKITEDGRIKVLDFGLAKAIAAAAGETSDIDPAHSPTVTVHGTRQGVILGTAAYMSPEQARGRRVDKRTDIWAFGCVLFEMLAGKKPFEGETTSDVIAAIIERAPDLNRLPASTPPNVRRVIERCLQKDPKRRARDIGDVAVDLSGAALPVTPPAPTASRLPLAAMAVVAILAAGVAAWRWPDAAARPAAPIELSFGAPPGHTLTATMPSVSPDGKHVAFVARDDQQVSSLWIRALDAPAPRQLEATMGATNRAEWSPDARSLAFFAGGAWKRVSIDGGPAVTITSGVGANVGASWGANDVFVFPGANRSALSKVTAGGGAWQPVTTLDESQENSHRWPLLLPDNRHFLFTARSDRPETLGIKLGALDSNAVRPLVNAASPARYAAPGWLLFVTPDEAVMAQRLNPATWSLEGTPQPITGRVRYNGPSFAASFDASADGRVVAYVPGSLGQAALQLFDRSGRALGRLGPEGRYLSVSLSRDGTAAIVELPDERIGTRDIFVIDTETQALRRLTSHPATDWRGEISPDGSTLAFASDRAGASTVFTTRITGDGGEATLYREPRGGTFPAAWFPDGTRVLVSIDDSRGRPGGIAIVPISGGNVERVIENDEGGLIMPSLSPDGSLIAFTSIATGRPEIYVFSLRTRQRVRVSTDEGSNVIWGRDGRELFFQNTRQELMRAAITAEPLAARPPEKMFEMCASVGRTYSIGMTERGYGVTSDGKFLIICAPADAVPQAINVIVNWQSKLR